jgi:hypothetical protein
VGGNGPRTFPIKEFCVKGVEPSGCANIEPVS